MLLHEYQAKALFHRYGMPVPRHRVASTALQVRQAAELLIADTVVVKAQVHSGGRTRAGGVKIVDTPREAEDYAQAMLGSYLVTSPSEPSGKPVSILLVEETCLVATELYLSIHTDPTTLKTLITAGREVSDSDLLSHEDQPQSNLFEIAISQRAGVQDYQCRQLSRQLKLSVALSDELTDLVFAMNRLFDEKNLSSIEINPLVITEDDRLVCLDGKITLSPEAMQSQPELQAMRDKSQENTLELPQR